jgi:hypothetical protein
MEQWDFTHLWGERVQRATGGQSGCLKCHMILWWSTRPLGWLHLQAKCLISGLRESKAYCWQYRIRRELHEICFSVINKFPKCVEWSVTASYKNKAIIHIFECQMIKNDLYILLTSICMHWFLSSSLIYLSDENQNF